MMQTRNNIDSSCSPVSLMCYCQAITLELSLPWGYKMKHAALHEAGNCDDGVVTLEAMLLTIERSPNPDTHHKLYSG